MPFIERLRAAMAMQGKVTRTRIYGREGGRERTEIPTAEVFKELLTSVVFCLKVAFVL